MSSENRHKPRGLYIMNEWVFQASLFDSFLCQVFFVSLYRKTSISSIVDFYSYYNSRQIIFQIYHL